LNTPQTQQRIRILRLIEYEGPRDLVEEQVRCSVHGTRYGMRGKPLGNLLTNAVRITATTLGNFPEIIEAARRTPDPILIEDLMREVEVLRKLR
jgi:hypothetical protein